MKPRIPAATYRLQFNREFRFADAQRIAGYLNELGISDIYASPILMARPGSFHGYDVIDPGKINPELGATEEFGSFATTLQDLGMGLLIDIVPNHMSASPENPWWFDVLEKGEASRYASFFDVDWSVSKKVLVPILGRPYGEALEQHEIELKVEHGRPVIQYYEHSLPVEPVVDRPNASIDEVLAKQHYRLAFWRKAADSINYRRFFDINDLVGLRSERDAVFRATHKLILKLVNEGKVTGLRIDHVDGLLDPKGYLDRLPEVYVAVEKILAGNERIPGNWRVHGTTGYDFLNALNGLFVDAAGFRRLEKIYAGVTGSTASYTGVFRKSKRRVMRELFAGEVLTLVQRLSELAEEDRHARDLSLEELKEAFVSVTACLPVYRTYIRNQHISDADRITIEDALKVAGSSSAVSFLRRVLLLDPAWYLKRRRRSYLEFVMRWQQFTGPVMAKGLEDTTFYVHNPLISVNEVGGDSAGPSVYLGVEEFHRRNLQRRKRWPFTMNATSTHDTKRSEDVRARIDVLSELPDDWARHLRRWLRMNPSETAPDKNEQIVIYQSLLGAWPIERDRVKQYLTKALREAKTHSSWIEVNADYERCVHSFVDSLYESETFLEDFVLLQKKVAYFGSLSSLSQLVLKITSPGIPDFYRGSELWELNLADPDNRRPVDFDARIEMLEGLMKHAHPEEMLRHWQDGRIKMFLAWKALTFRRERAGLFQRGVYIPLRVRGTRQDHLVAFARRLGSQWIVVAAARLMASLTRTGSPPIGEKIWRDTRVVLPPGAPRDWQDIFTGGQLRAPLNAGSMFAALPVSVAVSVDLRK